MKKTFVYYMLLIWILATACTEPYPITSETFEDILVVEATITDSLQYQTVKITKSYPLNTTNLPYVNNAQVWIENSDGLTYNFAQAATDSTYISNTPFKAEQNKSYVLHIVTEDGKKYISAEETTPQKITIDDLYAERYTNDLNVDGVQVYVNCFGDNSETPLYARFEYEETNKIVTPYLSLYEYDMQNVSTIHYASCPTYDALFYILVLNQRDEPVNTCYNTEKSYKIILASSENQQNNNTVLGAIRFINGDNYLIAERYSILVKAYSQNYASYQFYKNTQKLNSDENTLSPKQPGYIQGNIYNTNNNEEKIMGYFNVASLDTKRIFFNQTDFGFSNSGYFSECDLLTFDWEDRCPGVHEESERNKLYRYLVDKNYEIVYREGLVYTIANPECSNCTTFASAVVPDFWED